MRLLLLSGPMGSGKSSLAAELKKQSSFYCISTSLYLQKKMNSSLDSRKRLSMQDFGDMLDNETEYKWIVESLATPIIKSSSNVRNWLLDAVRKPRQVELLREHFGTSVKHVHIVAPEDELRRRYLAREQNESLYEFAIKHPNEIVGRSLGTIADKIFDTSCDSKEVIAEKILNLWEDLL